MNISDIILIFSGIFKLVKLGYTISGLMSNFNNYLQKNRYYIVTVNIYQIFQNKIFLFKVTNTQLLHRNQSGITSIRIRL